MEDLGIRREEVALREAGECLVAVVIKKGVLVVGSKPNHRSCMLVCHPGFEVTLQGWLLVVLVDVDNDAV